MGDETYVFNELHSTGGMSETRIKRSEILRYMKGKPRVIDVSPEEQLIEDFKDFFYAYKVLDSKNILVFECSKHQRDAMLHILLSTTYRFDHQVTWRYNCEHNQYALEVPYGILSFVMEYLMGDLSRDDLDQNAYDEGFVIFGKGNDITLDKYTY